MDQHLQKILDFIQQDRNLSASDKEEVIKSLKDADKKLEITAFKLDRTEKVKRTTSILLEETITELEQKRKAVEGQNKELEIESSLERVRTVAMSMNKPDDMLDVCQIISGQLEMLGTKEIRNVQTAIFYENKGTYINYEYYRLHDKALVTEVDYTQDTMTSTFASKMLKGAGEFFTESLTGQVLKDWFDYQKTTTQFPDPHLAEASSLNYYWFSLGLIALGISTYTPLNDEEINLFKRFRNVFELSYRRFLDIEKAEAQAREAQIELALERVRARTMAMQRSDELAETSFVLFQQFKDLGETSEQISIGIFKEEENLMELYSTLYGSQWKDAAKVDLDEPVVMKKIHKAWKEQKKSLVIDLSGKHLSEYNAYRKKLSNLEYREDRWVIHIAFFSKGALTFSTTDPHPAETIQLLERFAGVFDQTYTRFLDLQKAEAQARESQVEAALEKVRSRSLAVHKSDEFGEVVRVIFEKMLELKLPAYSTSINIQIDDSKDLKVYGCGQSDAGLKTLIYRLPYFDHPILNDLIHAHKSGISHFSRTYSSEEKNSFYEYAIIHSELKNLPADVKTKIFESGDNTITVALAKNSMILINDFDGKGLDEKQVDILHRFSTVFEQAYVRFLDLEKAEAQAKESQIQLALERVRARTMAMQKSDELKYAATLLFQQAKALGVPAYSCGYNIWEKGEKEFTSWMSTQDGSDINGVPNIPLTEDANFIRYVESKQKGEPFFVLELRGERMQEHYQYLKTIPAFKGYFDYAVSVGFDLPQTQIHHVANFSQGNLLFITLEPCPEFHDVFKRFAVVFEQTYTRFLDLQKAETQAREAKIEAALERTRTQSMIMQHSKELDDTLRVFHEQVLLLGIHSAFSFLWLPDEEEDRHIFWAVWGEDKNGSTVFKSKAINYPLDRNEPATAQCLLDWKSNEPVYSYHVPPAAVENYFAVWQELIDGVEQLKPEYFSGGLYYVEAFMKYGCFGVIAATDLNEDEKKTLGRFSTEFERTYTRFLDLQKAEAQAREANIEAALEKVRSKTMAMHNSQDVGDTVATLFDEFVKLGIVTYRCGIGIIHQEKKMEVWTAKRDANGKVNFFTGYMDMTMHPLLQGGYSAWNKKQESYIYELKGDDLKEYFSRSNNNPNYPLKYDIPSLPSRLIFSVFYFSEGFLFAFTLEELPAETTKIFKRFSGVFGQTYRRYLDLQKAEAQAREAQIELGLERVRARAMSMHNSNELSELVAILFEELVKLDLILARCIIWIFDKETLGARMWMANSEDKRNADSYYIKYLDHPYYDAIIKGWKERNSKWIYVLEGDFKKSLDELLLKETELTVLPAAVKAGIRSSEHTVVSGSFNNFGFIEASGPAAHSEEQLEILNRFGKVFDLSYTRFSDLQKAEAQAKESQIETSLERVRSRSMGMQKSEELKEVIQVVYDQFVHLNIKIEHTGFVIDYKARDDYDIWIADPLGVPSQVTVPYFDSVYYNRFNEAKEKGEDFFATNLDFEEKNRFYQKLFEYVPGLSEEAKEFYFSCPGLAASTVLLDNICLYIENFAGISYTEEENNTLMRFGKVFQQTYTRFLDLKKAEAQAKEATRQASLDRVRGQIASMRSTEDLQRITPLIWHELTMLDVPFIRCGVLIIDEPKSEAHIYLSSPDGHSLAAMNLPLQSNTLTANSVEYWRKGLVYTEHWDKEDFVRWMQSMIAQGQVQNTETYQGAAKPPESLHLHFVPFTQGMLYVGNTTLLTNDEIDPVKSLAEAFSIAYARYEDFIKLEKAKQSIEVTLTELRATQTQLIQSEKMASLGELTAGIAHEIQNPLNFVNNFSDVNKELLAELAEEIEKGNYEEVKIIANDVITNEEKISHHGRRADAIVKGMLQHSRSSSGQKEPTDINVLADEYLRLAYHGLRAKDKSFNATLQTDYDSTLKKINVIPQDIGRVILNLITNAFYAIHEKTKQQTSGYEPTISVSTKKLDNKISISVKDNGGGISKKVVDKIFQPFFTTKPTGQGTGLGLSLSYDIIKAHGGEIKVETKEGRGSEFIVQLPVV